MPDDVESYNNFEGVLSIYIGALLVQAAAAQNIMVVQRRKIHGVDFCGECNEFPCKNAHIRWRSIRQDMDSQPCHYSEVRGTQ